MITRGDFRFGTKLNVMSRDAHSEWEYEARKTDSDCRGVKQTYLTAKLGECATQPAEYNNQCTYIIIYRYIYMYIYIYLCIYIYMYTRVHIYICMSLCAFEVAI